jgi:hypothetical protein
VTRHLILGLALAAMASMAMPAQARPAPAPAEEELPVPPMPPDEPPADVAAPVPNADLSAPTPEGTTGPSLRATLNERPLNLPGGDPVPGTVYRSDQEQKHQFIPNPGVQLVVPLEK